MKTSGRRALRELEQSEQHDSGCVADTGDGGHDEPPSNLLATQKLGNSEPNIHSPADTLSPRVRGLIVCTCRIVCVRALLFAWGYLKTYFLKRELWVISFTLE